MSTLVALAKALAVEREIAQPLTMYRHVHITQQPLVFIPLAMAGEANAPLAALIGSESQEPRLLTVAEPRDRDQRFTFAAELAAILLSYLDTSEDPQLIVPNPAAVTFTRMLGRSTRLRRTTGEWAVRPEVRQHRAAGLSDLEDVNLPAVLAGVAPLAGSLASEARPSRRGPAAHPTGSQVPPGEPSLGRSRGRPGRPTPGAMQPQLTAQEVTMPMYTPAARSLQLSRPSQLRLADGQMHVTRDQTTTHTRPAYTGLRYAIRSRRRR